MPFNPFEDDYEVERGYDSLGLFLQITLGSHTRLLMRYIPPGASVIGGFPVTFTYGFWMSETMVTEGVYARLRMDDFQNTSQAPRLVSWHLAGKFCKVLNPVRGGDLTKGLIFRLPSEAEWVYACKAGAMTFPDPGLDVGDFAHGAENSFSREHVRGKKPNAWGLYDMLGCAWEWCADGVRAGEGFQPFTWEDPFQDNGTHRIRMGGCQDTPLSQLHSELRADDQQDLPTGFRLTLGPLHPDVE